VVKHVIGVCDLSLLVTDDWEAQFAARDLIDILDPSSVRLDGVGRKTDQLDPTLGELRLELCERPELGGADGCVILWVGEENNPLVADEVVEIDRTLGGLCLEVGSNGTQAERSGSLFSRHLEEFFGYLECEGRGLDDRWICCCIVFTEYR